MNRRSFMSRCAQIVVGALSLGCASKVIIKPYKHIVVNQGPSTHEIYVNGKLVYKMAWNRSLSAEEVKLIYNNPYCMFDQKQTSMWIT